MTVLTFGCCLLCAAVTSACTTIAERRHQTSQVTAGEAIFAKVTAGLLGALAGALAGWLLS